MKKIFATLLLALAFLNFSGIENILYYVQNINGLVDMPAYKYELPFDM